MEFALGRQRSARIDLRDLNPYPTTMNNNRFCTVALADMDTIPLSHTPRWMLAKEAIVARNSLPSSVKVASETILKVTADHAYNLKIEAWYKQLKY